MARPKILVFQHVPYEPLGTLDPLLRAAGFRIRYVNFGRSPEERPVLGRYAAIIVLGGPMNADDIGRYPHLATEVALLGEALERDMSVLGICLGAQLLAKALGGSVTRNADREIGWYDVSLTSEGRADAVLSSFSEVQRVFQWHEDGIALPPDAVHLASSAASPVQAFRFGDHAYGFQFHLEVDQPLIRRWMRVPDNRAMLREESERLAPESILRTAGTAVPDLEELSRQTFSRWIEHLRPPVRRVTMPSR